MAKLKQHADAATSQKAELLDGPQANQLDPARRSFDLAYPGLL